MNFLAGYTGFIQADDYNGYKFIDNNLMENSIRPIAVGKKNWLFTPLKVPQLQQSSTAL